MKKIIILIVFLFLNFGFVFANNDEYKEFSIDYDEITKNIEDYIVNEEIELNEEDYELFCNLVEAEAGNQDFVGKLLVANVVINRVFSERFKEDNIRDIILAPKQFSPVNSGTIGNVEPSINSKNAVDLALLGVDISDGATFFVNEDISDCSWFRNKLEFLYKYGDHSFFKSFD